MTHNHHHNLVCQKKKKKKSTRKVLPARTAWADGQEKRTILHSPVWTHHGYVLGDDFLFGRVLSRTLLRDAAEIIDPVFNCTERINLQQTPHDSLFPRAEPSADAALCPRRLVLHFAVCMVDLVHDGAACVLEGPLAVRDARFACSLVCQTGGIYMESGTTKEGGREEWWGTFADSRIDITTDPRERLLGRRL